MVKHIVFDFGGVLLNLDYQRTFDMLGDAMGRTLSYPDLSPEIHEVYLAFERGEMDRDYFINQLKAHSAGSPSTETLIDAWNGMLLGWNPARLPWLLELRKTYGVYLLSNTNALHIDWVRKDLATNHGIRDFETRYFDHAYYSHDMGKQKPNLDIYEQVISETGVNPGETLFIDDNVDNIAAARRAGLNAVQHNPNTEIIEMLDGYIKAANRHLA